MTEPRRPTIVVADDDELLAELIQHRLEMGGFDVRRAEDGEQALMLIRETRPDAVILDVMMPGIDGSEILRVMKTSAELKNIPVLMLTARRMERDIVDALALGADEYVTKPFQPDELLARLRRLLARAPAANGAGAA